ncbi:MAG: ABC transporter permease [Eubacteriales bacterium]|nr:ABC transporter permease [Eubacteriales bacterium]
MTRIYPGMAFSNIIKNRRVYLPYMIACTFTTAIYYIICSLGDNSSLTELWGGNIIRTYMGVGQLIVSIFAVIFLFYVNSFLLKRRQSEFGLYNILGMEKRHIAKIIAFETLYTYMAVAVCGTVFGILLDKLIYLILLKMLGAAVPVGFYISGSAIAKSLILTGAIFVLMLLNSIRLIHKARPVELLRSDSAGEREPKAKWALAVLGVILLGAGYYIAVTVKNPITAFMLFFAAVVLVIAGTYLLFTAGSIALLKLLRKNKNYYYRTKHFISISSMLYRMKRNAAGLANICILSTMVLVMVSATMFMYMGSNEMLRIRYPAEFVISASVDDPGASEAVSLLDDAISKEGLAGKDAITYRDLSINAFYDEKSGGFTTDPDIYQSSSAVNMLDQISTLVFIPLEDYNRCTGSHMKLDRDSDVLVYYTGSSAALDPASDTITIDGQQFDIRHELDSMIRNSNIVASINGGCFIIVKDISVIEKILETSAELSGDDQSFISFNYMTDIKGDPKENSDAIGRVYDQALAAISGLDADGSTDQGGSADTDGGNGESATAPGSTISLQCRSVESVSYTADFTGLFFIGIFLGLLFLMATVLIMYYKQLTEGYEDRKRFEILQNVGMSHTEVRRSINSQILIVFFLPLVMAGIHVTFDFPFIFRVMTLMNLFDKKLFALCTAGCFLAFTVFYIVVYLLTSRLYYRIVRK